jgi:hypothetical protein
MKFPTKSTYLHSLKIVGLNCASWQICLLFLIMSHKELIFKDIKVFVCKRRTQFDTVHEITQNQFVIWPHSLTMQLFMFRTHLILKKHKSEKKSPSIS